MKIVFQKRITLAQTILAFETKQTDVFFSREKSKQKDILVARNVYFKRARLDLKRPGRVCRRRLRKFKSQPFTNNHPSIF